MADLKKSYKTEFIPLEVGVRGIINKENRTSINKIAKLCTEKMFYKFLCDSISKAAVSSSYFIFLARDEEEWNQS